MSHYRYNSSWQISLWRDFLEKDVGMKVVLSLICSHKISDGTWAHNTLPGAKQSKHCTCHTWAVARALLTQEGQLLIYVLVPHLKQRQTFQCLYPGSQCP